MDIDPILREAIRTASEVETANANTYITEGDRT